MMAVRARRLTCRARQIAEALPSGIRQCGRLGLRSRMRLEKWREGVLFVERLPGLEAVVELAEEAVEKVALGGVVPVAVLASAALVGVCPG